MIINTLGEIKHFLLIIVLLVATWTFLFAALFIKCRYGI